MILAVILVGKVTKFNLFGQRYPSTEKPFSITINKEDQGVSCWLRFWMTDLMQFVEKPHVNNCCVSNFASCEDENRYQFSLLFLDLFFSVYFSLVFKELLVSSCSNLVFWFRLIFIFIFFQECFSTARHFYIQDLFSYLSTKFTVVSKVFILNIKILIIFFFIWNVNLTDFYNIYKQGLKRSLVD